MKGLTATKGSETWPITAERMRDGGYKVVGRGTMMLLHVKRTLDGYLVSIPNFQRCGEVPKDVNARDMAVYCGIDSPIDAATAAVAVRAIIAGELEGVAQPKNATDI